MSKTQVVALGLAVGLVCSFATSAGGAPVPSSEVVATDPDDDWGPPPGTSHGGDLGQELVKASIGLPSPSSLEFTMHFSELPAALPSTNVYWWRFDVTGHYGFYELRRCFEECAGNEASDRDFLLLDCEQIRTANAATDECVPQRILTPEIDRNAATITIQLKRRWIGAFSGTTIGPAMEVDQHVWATTAGQYHWFFGVGDAFPVDHMRVGAFFELP